MSDPAAGALSSLDREARQEAVCDAITSRRSIRGFLEEPVPKSLIYELLSVASRAPSGSNMQPWKVYVLTGETLANVTHDLCAAHDNDEPETREYDYYPSEWRSPYIERRRAAGWGLFELVGVKRGDREASRRQHRRNYEFFGAPVGLVFTIDDDLEQGSWLDYGMFLEALMVAARAYGLDTCPQAAVANYPPILRKHLEIPDSETVVCGMALGYADPGENANRLVTTRDAPETFTRFFD